MTESIEITIDIEGTELLCTVEFDYQPEEKQTWECPGEAEEFHITKIEHHIGDRIVDFSALCEIEDLHDSIVELLKQAGEE